MPSTPNPRILLVDDHALFRTGLGMILREAFPGSTLLEAPTLADAMKVEAKPPLDLLLLDVHLPDANGLSLIQVLQDRFGPVPVLMVSGSDDASQVTQARDAGAVGYLSKAASGAQMVSTLRECLSGGQAFPFTDYVQAPAAMVLVARQDPVSPSERQLSILRLLGQGAPNKAIARQVGLSENDVRAEVSWLTEMLDATSRQQAYEAAVQRGWLAP
ncbi:MAG: response regulator transcription factor [Aquabacterium sp.]|uniref:response regulator transcription factor n=1 Tax=Aquabacterium sp. TaxID=1872578 RepID=UPI002727D9C8|nr:response regulator transcription factor [Aquabacterium sp.]MDO9005785.1 response regulator transcription factor [Aquabacterium sp.]